MAARRNPYHTERVLARIQLAKLVERLQKNALGTLRYPTGGRKPDGTPGSEKGKTIACEMTDGQIRATTFLVERLIPRAAAPIQMGGLGDAPIECLVRFVAAKEAK